MHRRLLKSEVWLSVSGWPYEASCRGHVRRKRSHRLINPWWDSDGYGTVILQSGPKREEFYIDSVIASAFTGQRVNGQRPIHLNGQPWDSWAINLDWGIGSQPYDNMTNLVIHWTVWHDGKMQHGPFDDYAAVKAAASRIGDIIIGRNPKREIIAFQVVFSRNQAMSPMNPFDLVRKYEALAKQHPDHFWSHELLEAAAVIASLAADSVNAIPAPNTAAKAPSSAVHGANSAPPAEGGKLARRPVASPQAPAAGGARPRRPLTT